MNIDPGLYCLKFILGVGHNHTKVTIHTFSGYWFVSQSIFTVDDYYLLMVAIIYLAAQTRSLIESGIFNAW
jgi:hypothetical protein